MKSNSSLKNNIPRIVAKSNFENSKGIKFVNVPLLSAFVHKKFPIVATPAITINKIIISKLSGLVQTYNDGRKDMGAMRRTILNINKRTDSVFEICLTKSPATAWVKDAIRAIKTPNLSSRSGLIRMIVKINPKIIAVVFIFKIFSLKKIILPRYIKSGVVKLIAIACDNGISE